MSKGRCKTIDKILNPKLAAAKEAGSKIDKGFYDFAELIEKSAHEDEAIALWNAFVDAVDPDIGEGAGLCIKDVWRFVNWDKVNWPKTQKALKEIRERILSRI